MCTSPTSQLQEALTIPPNKDDMHEVELRAKMPKGYVHGDRVIRWYRNAKKDGADDAELSRWVDNFANVEDLLKTYDEYIKKLGTMKMLDKKVKLDFNDKQIEVDLVKDVDKIRRLKGFAALVKALGDIVHSGNAIHTTSQKYALDDKDKKLIKLISYTSKVMVWQTQQYATTNKFIYQLWQNAETLGRGDVYGDPSDQTPYCTHSMQHWNEYSNGNADYTQYWFLRTLPDAKPSATGDLDNADVVKVFNAMQGKGADLLIAMDDSGGDFLDDEDRHVNSSYDNIFPDVVNDVIQLRKKLPYFVKMQDKLHKLFKECINDDNALDMKMFKTNVTQLANTMPGRVWAFFDKDWFESLHVKKIIVRDMLSYQLNALVKAIRLKRLPVVSFLDNYVDQLPGLFEECNDIEEVAGIENANAHNVHALFRNCANLKYVHNVSCLAAEQCASMFSGCRKLKHIGQINLPKCKYAGSMLYDCNELVHIGSVDIGNTYGRHCLVDVEDMEGDVKNVLPSADRHTQQLIANVVRQCIQHENAHYLNMLKRRIMLYNTDLVDDFGFRNGTVECTSNDDMPIILAFLRDSYNIRLTPNDDISCLNAGSQNAIQQFYRKRMTPLPLHVECIDLTKDNDIMNSKSFPYIDDTHVETSFIGKTIDLPSIKITAKQAKYKDTIFNGRPMSKHMTRRLRAKYGDNGEKINWIIVDDITEESAQIRAELNDFRRLFF